MLYWLATRRPQCKLRKIDPAFDSVGIQSDFQIVLHRNVRLQISHTITVH